MRTLMPEVNPRPVVEVAAASYPRHAAVVYYVTDDECGGIVKIGTTVRLPQRLARLAKSAKVRPQVLGLELGDDVLEAQRHRQFAHLRLAGNGEWFWHRDDLDAWIESLPAVRLVWETV